MEKEKKAMKKTKDAGKEEKTKVFKFSVDELELTKYFFTLKNCKYNDTNSNTFVIFKRLWESGHNSILFNVVRYFWNEKREDIKNLKIEGYKTNLEIYDKIAILLYKFMAYASYTVEMSNSIFEKDKKNKKEGIEEKDSRIIAESLSVAKAVEAKKAKYKDLLFIDEFETLREEIDRSSINIAVKKMFNFLFTTVDSDKTKSSWALHFNNGNHPRFFPEQEKQFWDNMDDRNKTKMSAAIGLFSEDTDPIYAFAGPSEQKKFDVIIATVINESHRWTNFEFETSDLEGMKKCFKEDPGRNSYFKLVACLLDQAIWEKHLRLDSATLPVHVRNLSDYKLLCVDHNINMATIKFLFDGEIVWTDDTGFTFKYKSSYLEKKHKYKLSKAGLEILD